MSGLDVIFRPSSIAIVGASRKREKLGHVILKNVIDAGFEGGIYPVNPKAEDVLGLTAYPSIGKVPAQVDLAVVVIPSRFVPQAMEEAVEKGTRGFVVISGGFREVGGEGKELEEEIVSIARRGSARIIGPNCQGITNPHTALCASWPLMAKKGSVSVVSQSGTVAAFMGMELEREQIGVSKFVALGNKADVDEVDMLDYLVEDDETEVVALYLEGTSRGTDLIRALRRCSEEKSVVVLKSGRTEAGREAVESHTGSLAGRDEIYDVVFRQAGAIRAPDLESFFDYSKALARYGPIEGPDVLVVTSSGGSGILSSDALEMSGLRLSELSEDLLRRLRDALPGFCVIRNPLDLTGSAYADLYKTALELCLEAPIHAFLLIFGDPIPGAVEVVDAFQKATERPIVVSYLGGGGVQFEEIREFVKRGIPVFSTPERAAGAIFALWKRGKRRPSPET